MTFLGLRATDDLALIDAETGSRRTYRELLSAAERAADLLGEGKALVFLSAQNDIASVTTFLATQLAGHAVALLDGTMPTERHVRLIRHYRPDRIVAPRGMADQLRSAGMEVDVLGEVEGHEVVTDRSPVAADRIHPSLALMLGTSASTGSKKYVRLSLRNIETNARAIAGYLGLTRSDRPMTSLPIHYTFGLSVLTSHWAVGAAMILTGESVIRPSFWEMVREHASTSIAGVPYTYQMLERIGYREMDLPSVRLMQQAGGALDRHLTRVYADHMAARGGRFFVMYGQTEATARMTYVPPERLADKIGSAGIAIAEGALTIDTQTPGSGPGAGEVVYRGPNVMLGYVTRPEDLAQGDELGGILRTGDIGYLDADGFLFLTGRSKRIAKVTGRRVNLDEVETLLREHGPAAVVADDDVILGFCAFDGGVSLDDIRIAVARQLRIHRTAIELRQVLDLPISTSGKIDYTEVERWLSH